jgi:hypothetical protein
MKTSERKTMSESEVNERETFTTDDYEYKLTF